MNQLGPWRDLKTQAAGTVDWACDAIQDGQWKAKGKTATLSVFQWLEQPEGKDLVFPVREKILEAKITRDGYSWQVDKIARLILIIGSGNEIDVSSRIDSISEWEYLSLKLMAF